MNSIRLDERATIIMEDLPAARRVDAEAARRIFDEVRQADFVIDSHDQVIKDVNGMTPRGAMMTDVELARLVTG